MGIRSSAPARARSLARTATAFRHPQRAGTAAWFAATLLSAFVGFVPNARAQSSGVQFATPDRECKRKVWEAADSADRLIIETGTVRFVLFGEFSLLASLGDLKIGSSVVPASNAMKIVDRSTAIENARLGCASLASLTVEATFPHPTNVSAVGTGQDFLLTLAGGGGAVPMRLVPMPEIRWIWEPSTLDATDASCLATEQGSVTISPASVLNVFLPPTRPFPPSTCAPRLDSRIEMKSTTAEILSPVTLSAVGPTSASIELCTQLMCVEQPVPTRFVGATRSARVPIRLNAPLARSGTGLLDFPFTLTAPNMTTVLRTKVVPPQSPFFLPPTTFQIADDNSTFTFVVAPNGQRQVDVLLTLDAPPPSPAGLTISWRLSRPNCFAAVNGYDPTKALQKTFLPGGSPTALRIPLVALGTATCAATLPGVTHRFDAWIGTDTTATGFRTTSGEFRLLLQ